MTNDKIAKQRDKLISLMCRKANALVKNYSWEGYFEIWEMCSNWNSEHDFEYEIFMSDHDNEETELVDGFYIEDDYWIFEELEE